MVGNRINDAVDFMPIAMRGKTLFVMQITIKLTIGILLLIVSSVWAQPIFPEGWRIPKDEETSGELDWRDEDPNRFLTVQADFDGDGSIDEAKMLINDLKKKIGIFVFLSENKKLRIIQLIEFENNSRLKAFGIAKVNPRKYETACGKGYFDCSPDEPDMITLTKPGINFFQFESASVFFYWDDRKKSFKKAQISD